MRLSHSCSYVIRIMVTGVICLCCCVTNWLYFFFFFSPLVFWYFPYILNFGPYPVCSVLPCLWSGSYITCLHNLHNIAYYLHNAIHKRIRYGLKYVNLSFTNNNVNDSGKGDLRKSAGGESVVNSGYIRHSDYFPGGMDSANTEATLISRNTNGGSFEWFH